MWGARDGQRPDALVHIPRDFAVFDSPEFVVLLPKITLDDFGRSQEPENCRVSRYESAGRSTELLKPFSRSFTVSLLF